MLSIDRSGFIELLDRLGAEDDATALAAARELHRHMSEADLRWDDLLLPEPGAEPEPDQPPAEEVLEDEAEADEVFEDEAEESEDAVQADETEADEAEEAEELEEEDETEAARAQAAEAEPLSAAVLAEDARLIERLLAKKTLSKTMREELTDMKQAIADGEFDAMDSRYVRALNKRLGP